MAGKTTKPLTTEEAKQRLRCAASEAGLAAWVKRRPLSAIGCGLLAGALLASSPRTRDLLLQAMSHQLVRSLLWT